MLLVDGLNLQARKPLISLFDIVKTHNSYDKRNLVVDLLWHQSYVARNVSNFEECNTQQIKTLFFFTDV